METRLIVFTTGGVYTDTHTNEPWMAIRFHLLRLERRLKACKPTDFTWRDKDLQKYIKIYININPQVGKTAMSVRTFA